MPGPIDSRIKPAPKNPDSVSVPKPKALGQPVRVDISKDVADKLEETVKKYKDVAGNGQDVGGGGDPRITERRSALSVLLANKTGTPCDLATLEALSPNIKSDLLWLRAADRSDYSIGKKGQFDWSQSVMSKPDDLEVELDRRVKYGTEAADSLIKGQDTFLDVTGGTLIALSFLKDRARRAAALGDALLQFRAKSDKSNQQSFRVDLIGPVAVAEQRIVLAGAALGGQDSQSRREYALLRLAIGSHPLSSVNSVFHARNAVGQLQKNGGKRITTVVAPGASQSPYESIHHNFSGDTPKNIALSIGAFLFPEGPANERAPLFVKLVDAMNTARDGQDAQARAKLAGLAGTSMGKTICQLLDEVEKAQDGQVADVILRALEAAGGKSNPLGPKSEENLGLFAELLKAVGSAKPLPPAAKDQAIAAVEQLIQNGAEYLVKVSGPDHYSSIKSVLDSSYSYNDPLEVTQEIIAHFVFVKGPQGERAAVFSALCEALQLARAGKAAEARALVGALDGTKAGTVAGLVQEIASGDGDAVAGKLLAFLEDGVEKIYGALPEENFGLAAKMYEAVCSDQPTVTSLEQSLFRAGAAWPEVADVIARMRAGDEPGLLQDLGKARLALQKAAIEASTGYERHELLRYDTQLDRLTLQELGSAVARAGDLASDGEKAEALLAVQTALRASAASGLDAIADEGDLAAQKGRPLAAILADVDGMLAGGRVSGDAYRAIMAEVYVASQRIVQNLRHFFDKRAGDVATSTSVELDPEFLDQLVKQSPLHYLTALSEKGMRAGLQEEIGAREVKNVTGMRVLNSIGPVVFTDVVFAENTTELIKLQPPRGALSVLYALSEKKMVSVGGLIADVKDAPGGNSHLNMYAMNNGIPVLALPELRTKYRAFFDSAMREGGIYIDDQNQEFKMMTVGLAKERGLITDASILGLKPGTNKRIKYLKASGDSFEQIAQHEAIMSPARPMREIELYIPMTEVKGVGRKCTSFLELAALGTQARHLAGEKGTVLALLKADAGLAKYVPDGSVVTTGRVRSLLAEAGLYDAWHELWAKDPVVGRVDDQNFAKSAFYTDPKYRAKKRDQLQHQTKEKLQTLLIATDVSGKKTLTAAGDRLYAELEKNPALRQSDNWIARSSFTGEDRPNKSGAGQYESFPHLKDPVARVEGIIGVIESAWMAEPVENNVSDQINLMHIMPAVVVQHCLAPEHSGVMISRDLDSGGRGIVSYQLVKGFGGGVEGGKTEEGIISAGGHSVKVQYPGEPGGLVDAAGLKELREVVLGTEKFFNDVVEPGRGEAVDMEVARVGGGWNIVQARVIGMDK